MRPDYAEAESHWGRVLIEEDRPAEAMKHLERFLQLWPDQYMPHFNLGKCLELLGKVQRCQLHFRKCIELDPVSAKAHNDLGFVLSQQGKTHDAMMEFRKTVELKPDDAEAHTNLAEALQQSHALHEAAEQFEEALKSNPDQLAALTSLTALRSVANDSQLRDGKEALRLAEHANELSGGKDPVILRVLALAYAETGQFSKAAEIARQALALLPADAPLHDLIQANLRRYDFGPASPRIAMKHRTNESVWSAKEIGFAVLLCAAAFLAYWPALSGKFVWDDGWWTGSIADLLKDLRGLGEMWTHPTALQQYYPVTGLTFWLDHHAWGSWTLPYHVENVLLRFVSALLLAPALPAAGAGSWLAAGFFALHPMMVESVAWIAERKNVLSLALFLGALLAYGKFTGFWAETPRPRRWGAYALALLLFALALLARTSVFVFPGAAFAGVVESRPRALESGCAASAAVFCDGDRSGAFHFMAGEASRRC